MLTLRRRMPIAIVRLDDLRDAVQIGRALAQGGVTAIEFTLTNEEAPDAIAAARAALPADIQVGAGTVINAAGAQRSIAAGAQFLVTPAFIPAVLTIARVAGIPVVCGAYTPTEILAAWEAGAMYVKVFPVRSLGPTFIKDVLAPLPMLHLVPVGGITLENCAAYIAAGAYTVAVASDLVSVDLVHRQDWATLTKRASQYVKACV